MTTVSKVCAVSSVNYNSNSVIYEEKEYKKLTKYIYATFFSKFYFNDNRFYCLETDDLKDLYIVNGIKFDKFIKNIFINKFDGKLNFSVPTKSQKKIILASNVLCTDIILGGIPDLKITKKNTDSAVYMEVKWVSEDDKIIDIFNPSWMFQILHYSVLYESDVLFVVCSSKKILYNAILKYSPEFLRIIVSILSILEGLNGKELNIYNVINVDSIKQYFSKDLGDCEFVTNFVGLNLKDFREYIIASQ